MNLKPAILGIFCVVCSSLVPVAAQQKTEGRTFDFGFEQRIRNEDWNNIFDWNGATDDQRAQIRYRTRVWGKLPLAHNADFYAGLNQESNQIVDPRPPFHMDEIIFENAYVDFKKILIPGLSLRVGRQNISKGEGFIFLEGNPWDGSRSIYFNAFNLAYTAKKSRIEIIGILNPARDRFLPKINNKRRQLVEWDEQALGVYCTDNNLKRTSLEAYYIYKKETGDRRASTNPQFQPDRHLSTAGGRLVQKLNQGWEATGELAVQWGAQHPSTPVRGMGGYAYVKKSFSGAWKPSFAFGYIGMSGDNPATKDKIEDWDPIFSRWPKWSELYIYTQLKERGVAYWTNTGMWSAETVFTPHPKLSARMTFYKMDAYHPFGGNVALYGTGTHRGDHYQARLDLNLNKHWKGHVLYEHLRPGDFYAGKSSGHFLRFEIILLLNGRIAM